jgi:hypothetical protein
VILYVTVFSFFIKVNNNNNNNNNNILLCVIYQLNFAIFMYVTRISRYI